MIHWIIGIWARALRRRRTQLLHFFQQVFRLGRRLGVGEGFDQIVQPITSFVALPILNELFNQVQLRRRLFLFLVGGGLGLFFRHRFRRRRLFFGLGLVLGHRLFFGLGLVGLVLTLRRHLGVAFHRGAALRSGLDQ